MRWRAATATVLLVAVALGGPGGGGRAEAEHEPYYRYVVLGYAKDVTGKPIRALSVELVRNKTGFSYLGDTDETGFYVIVARLGDESAGEQLTLTVGSARTTITARFDPSNHADERGTRVDLERARLVERTAWFRPTLARFMNGRP
jgi:hypothetical protein